MKKAILRILAGLAAIAVLVLGSLPWLVTRDREAKGPDIGYSRIDMVAPHRGRSISLSLWYPARDDARPELIGQNALFYGFHAISNAKAGQGPYPLILLSHGSGGNARALGWFAAELARHGFVVAAPDHPGTMSNDSIPALTPQLWNRTGDLTAALDTIFRTRPFGIEVDPARISAAGFSLGGAAALSLSGARLSKAMFVSYCATGGDKPDCDWMASNGVDFSAIDQGRYEADLSDKRIGSVIAIDPALVAAMPEDNLRALGKPTLLVNLGSKGAIKAAMDVSRASAFLADARTVYIPGAYHFSFLAECSPMGNVVIALAGDDNICSDFGYRARGDIHGEIIKEVLAFLAKQG